MAQELQYHLDIAPESQWVFHTAGPAARSHLLYVQEAGDFQAGPDYYTVREGFDSFLIKLTLSGCGLLDYSGRQYRIPAGHFYWIDCQNRQRYQTDPETGSWRVLWVHFQGAGARFYHESFLQQTGGEPVGTLSLGAPAYDLLRQILALHSGSLGQAEKDLRSASLLTQLLTQLLLCVMRPLRQAQTPALMERIRQFLAEHYQSKLTLAQLGTQFGLSPCYLQRQFKQRYGQSPTEYLMLLRIVHAKELLRMTQKSIGEIAYAVGFENLGYFTRLFKRQEGLTPQEYRRLWPSMEQAAGGASHIRADD